MRIIELKRFVNSSNKATHYYGRKVTLRGSRSSPAIAMPENPSQSISVSQSGSASIYLTHSCFTDITNDRARWILYDGTSKINDSITAVRVVNSSGSTTVQITVKRL